MVRGWRTSPGALGTSLLAATIAACAGGADTALRGRGLAADGSVLAVPSVPPDATGEAPPVAVGAPIAAPGRATLPAAESVATHEGKPETRKEAQSDAEIQPSAPSDPVEDAIALAAELCSQERHRDALLVLDSALATPAALPGTGSVLLTVARARVLRDLGRRHLAAAALREVVAAHGAPALTPALLFELAELEWLEGERQAALERLEVIRSAHAGDPWLREHARDLDGLQREASTAPRPARLQIRDLLGNLRGAPEPTERMRALELAVAPLRNPTPQALDAAQRLRAIVVAIAAADSSAAIRARAVQLAEVDAAWSRDLCAAALEDPAPVVRAIAASRSIELLRDQAPTVLFAALAKEQDPGTFARLHESLAMTAAPAPRIEPGDEASPERRAALVAAWRQRLSSPQAPNRD